MTIQKWLRANDYIKVEDAYADYFGDSEVPALCIHKCTVGSNENCIHGAPSILTAIEDYQINYYHELGKE